PRPPPPPPPSRLYGSGKPVFALDSAYSVGVGDITKDVRGILMTPARTLWVISDKAKSAVPFGADGKAGAGLGGEDLQSVSMAATGELLVVAARAVRIGPKNLQT